jgi:hypothetical protein
LGIDRSGAVLAHDPVRPLEEAHGTTDLTGIKDRYDLVVRLLIEEEANLNPMLLYHKAV